MDNSIYILTKYNENQWVKHEGKFVRYFVKDINDIILAVKEYCKDFNYILKEDKYSLE